MNSGGGPQYRGTTTLFGRLSDVSRRGSRPCLRIADGPAGRTDLVGGRGGRRPLCLLPPCFLLRYFFLERTRLWSDPPKPVASNVYVTFAVGLGFGALTIAPTLYLTPMMNGPALGSATVAS